VLLTGFFGGAVAVHVRIGEPFWIPLAVAAAAWVGLYLRDDGIRGLVRRMTRPGRHSQTSTPAPALRQAVSAGRSHEEGEAG
jgi:hypothetical protein